MFHCVAVSETFSSEWMSKFSIKSRSSEQSRTKMKIMRWKIDTWNAKNKICLVIICDDEGNVNIFLFSSDFSRLWIYATMKNKRIKSQIMTYDSHKRNKKKCCQLASRHLHLNVEALNHSRSHGLNSRGNVIFSLARARKRSVYVPESTVCGCLRSLLAARLLSIINQAWRKRSQLNAHTIFIFIFLHFHEHCRTQGAVKKNVKSLNSIDFSISTLWLRHNDEIAIK